MFETANAGFAQAMYEEFLKDPATVGPDWRRLFESGVVGERPPAVRNGSRTADKTEPSVPAEPSASSARALPAGASPIKGPAAKLVANMNESLTVPTATTLRVVPVGVLEERRRRLNRGLEAAGRPSKVSFTHLIAYAVIQATKQYPVMGHTLVTHDGTSYRVVPEGIALGLAVDVQRKDGSRGLVVPVIKRADTMDFAGFHAAYEALVDKARNNRLMPDDFAGATMSLTNPGGLGTVASVPRLMAGQGAIIAVGAIGYPAEFSGVAQERLREFGISKVMTITSTYD
ncbi:MAG: 2-oxo acid dehydrogenase subunit E2, partial [Gemmatimonadales bacterium]